MRRVAIALLLWTAVGVVFATQLYFAGLSSSRALAWTLPRWYAWGLVAPGVFALDRRLARATSFTNRIVLHVPLAAAWTSLTVLLRFVRRGFLTPDVPNNAGQFFRERFYSDLPIYAVLVGISFARQFARQKTDLERELVAAQLQTLRAQLQPHFLFNALNTISSFTESSPQTARRLMAKLGDLLRRSLRHAAQSTVPLSEELTFLDDFVAIESARFEDRLRVTVSADDAVLPLMVPSFLLQPIVENAIRHGAGARVAGGHVEVTAAREGSSVHIRVRDDGVGLPPGWTFDRDAGVGLRNVAARLQHLYSRKGLLRVNPIPSGGVEVHIEVPVA